MLTRKPEQDKLLSAASRHQRKNPSSSSSWRRTLARLALGTVGGGKSWCQAALFLTVNQQQYLKASFFSPNAHGRGFRDGCVFGLASFTNFPCRQVPGVTRYLVRVDETSGWRYPIKSVSARERQCRAWVASNTCHVPAARSCAESAHGPAQLIGPGHCPRVWIDTRQVLPGPDDTV